MATKPQIISGRISRLQVFAVLKRIMLAEGRCPPAIEVAKILGWRKEKVRYHMKHLNGATGLPLPVTLGIDAEAKAELYYSNGVMTSGKQTPEFAPLDAILRG